MWITFSVSPGGLASQTDFYRLLAKHLATPTAHLAEELEADVAGRHARDDAQDAVEAQGARVAQPAADGAEADLAHDGGHAAAAHGTAATEKTGHASAAIEGGLDDHDPMLAFLTNERKNRGLPR